MYNQEVLSYTIGFSPSVDFVLEMLNKGLSNKICNKTIIHSDQGFQYQNIKYQEKLREYGAIQSMSRKGNCYDNAKAESFFSHIKAEFFNGVKFSSVGIFIKRLKSYIEYRNHFKIN